MQIQSVDFHEISFTYEEASRPLLERMTCRFPVGWTGIVGANGTGKTTILRLASGELKPQAGHVRIPGSAVYCEQRTDDLPPLLADLIRADSRDACRIKARLGIANDWAERWETLSHGERKRGQIGGVLWCSPDVLAVDEPTNHLDRSGRDLLAEAMALFKGIGLLVSHDRELLDALCLQCLFLDPPEARMRPGGYTKGYREAGREEAEQLKKKEQLKQAEKKLKQQAVKRRIEASQSDRRFSKKVLSRKDHDAREKIDRARVTGKDAGAGRLLRRTESRLDRARKKHDSVKVKKTYEVGIGLPGSHSKRNALFTIQEGSIPLGDARRLRYPDLMMQPEDRIALTGRNGAGKSSLLQRIVDALDFPEERLAYVPQEIERRASIEILSRARSLPKDKLGVLMNVVSRLGSRPERLLESEEPSPGETRKLLLALGMAYTPHLIIMDEPTNHLDLPAIECLGDALDECPCGLLLVSHDRLFLHRLTRLQWHISLEKDGSGGFTLQKGMLQD